MSQAEDILAAAGVPVLMTVHGRSITYTPAGGDGVSLTAVVGPEQTQERDGRDGLQVRVVRQVVISLDPDGDWGGVADPKSNDTVTIDSKGYALDQVTEVNGALATVRVVRIQHAQKSRPGYRQER